LRPHSTRVPRRTITVRREQAHQALQRARARATTEEFKTLSAQRAGVEGTTSQGVRAMGLRRSRSIGQEKTHLQHVATAAAMNIVRVVRWLDGVPMHKRGVRPCFGSSVRRRRHAVESASSITFA
jgi:transposase